MEKSDTMDTSKSVHQQYLEKRGLASCHIG